MQYLQNKDYQHHKWRQQKSWISYPDCLVAMDKQQTQYQLIPKWKMEDAHKIIENSQIGMSRHLDSSTTTQVAQIMVQYGRPSRSSSWTKSVYGHPLAGLLWERQFEKFVLKYGWEKVPTWECLFVHREKRGYSHLCVYVDDKKLAGKKQNIYPMWKVLNKEVDLGEPTSFLDHVYLGCNSKTMWIKQRYCWQWKNHVWIQNFRRSDWKNYHARKFFTSLHGPTIWRVMPKNVWNDIVSWQTRRLNNSTRYPLLALTTIISKKKNWNPWENCLKYALKLFWNACTWHGLEDLIFYGQWINLHDRSQNGSKPVTNDYLVWSLTFIIHVHTNSIAMCETLPNNADWDCFKTPILQEILRIQNLHQVEHGAFLEAIHLSQSVACVRNRLQFRTVQQNQKSFPWMQDWD